MPGMVASAGGSSWWRSWAEKSKDMEERVFRSPFSLTQNELAHLTLLFLFKFCEPFCCTRFVNDLVLLLCLSWELVLVVDFLASLHDEEA